MACPLVATGSQFLVQTLHHLDCQAQSLGSFGFQALVAPGSPASAVLLALLTLFVALFAIRLLFGSALEPSDGVGAVLKIGIVLTLAFSWPAVRVLAYDTVLRGPAEVAAAIIPASMPSSRGGFAERLQNIDRGIASLTAAGTGRQTGSLALEEQPDGAFRTIALEDSSAFGWSRTLLLAGIIAPLAVVRLAGGLLLALTPLFAGALLFEASRGLFAGWLRGLVLIALASLGLTVTLSLQVAILEPWLADVLNRRSLGYATPSAPTELLAMAISFGMASFGMLAFLGKVAFQQDWRTTRWTVAPISKPAAVHASRPALSMSSSQSAVHSRAVTISDAVTSLVRREDRARAREAQPVPNRLGSAGVSSASRASAFEPIGSGYRRTMHRTTRAHARRDGR